MGKVIHRELCKRLKFDHTDKWYLHKLEYVPENKPHEILFDSENQTDKKNSRSEDKTYKQDR